MSHNPKFELGNDLLCTHRLVIISHLSSAFPGSQNDCFEILNMFVWTAFSVVCLSVHWSFVGLHMILLPHTRKDQQWGQWVATLKKSQVVDWSTARFKAAWHTVLVSSHTRRFGFDAENMTEFRYITCLL